MKTKKVPMRMCIACKEMMPKKSLLRIVKNKEDGIIVDTTGKVSGKGAYICKNKVCFEKIRKSNALGRAFEMKIDDEIYIKVEELI